MANGIRRQPQGSECNTNPEASGCEGFGGTLGIIQSTTQPQDPSLDRATNVFATSAVATNNVVSVVTIISTNLDSVVWTSSYTTTLSLQATADPTTVALTAPIRTTSPAVATDPPEAQSASKSSNVGGVSKGAVAGIAIGTCIAGAIIAFVVAWLLYKRRDKKFMQKTCPSGYPIYADSSPELVMVQKSAANGGPYVQVSQAQMRTPIPAPARVPAASPQAVNGSLTGILPPAATEHDIGIRISALFAEVKRHIETYYRDVHASITPSMDSDLASFGKDVDMLNLLQNCSHPTVALQHALVTFVLGITGPKQGGLEQTLWPSELTSFIKPQQSGTYSFTNTMQAMLIYPQTRRN